MFSFKLKIIVNNDFSFLCKKFHIFMMHQNFNEISRQYYYFPSNIMPFFSLNFVLHSYIIKSSTTFFYSFKCKKKYISTKQRGWHFLKMSKKKDGMKVFFRENRQKSVYLKTKVYMQYFFFVL